MKSNVNINPYYIGYSLLTISLREENFYTGLSKALFITKIFTSSTDAILYKMGDNDKYFQFNNSYLLSQNIGYITKIVNENKESFNNNYYDIKDNMIIIPLSTSDNKYVLVLSNPNILKDRLKELLDVLKNSFRVILSKMEMYYDIQKKGEKDALTGIDNRLVYNNIIDYLKDNPHIYFSFAYLDLFRLKYVNDNYGYEYGDMYIKEGANIIKSFFPKQRFIHDEKGNIKRVDTGDYVFRIGGDEFAIISIKKSYAELKNIIDNYIGDVKIELPIEDNIPLYINYGVSERINMEEPENVFKRANEQLSENKRIMYKNLGIERRR